MTRDQAKQITEKILSLSNYPECSVHVSSSEEAYTRFANNGVTTASFAARQNASISSTRDGRTGTTQTDQFDDASLMASVRKSEELAAIAPPNPEHQPPPGPQEFRETNDYDEKTARARAPEMAPRIKTILDRAMAKKLVAAGLFERVLSETAIANKAGLYGYHRATDSRLSTTIRMRDGSSSGWAGLPAVRIDEIDGAALADAAIEKCLRWRNPQRIEPGKFTVLLEPTAAGDLVRLLMGGFMGMPFSARSTDEGRTFLSKKGGGTLLGEKLFPTFINLRSNPFSGRQPANPWSPEQLPNRAVDWIENGVVKNLYYDRYWAAKTGNAPTPFPVTLEMDGTEASVADLIKTVDRGLLVTHFWYIRFVNPQTVQNTGLTRDGLFLIEDGKITQPVVNLRFNESPVRLLQNAQRLGKATRVRGLEGGMMIVPSIVAKDFTFSSISDAV